MEESPTTHDWDVVIVGAGPVGGHTANLLSARGHRVLLLEPAAEEASPEAICTRLDAMELAVNNVQEEMKSLSASVHQEVRELSRSIAALSRVVVEHRQ